MRFIIYLLSLKIGALSNINKVPCSWRMHFLAFTHKNHYQYAMLNFCV